MTDGLVVAAPASGSGKTLVTLGLLRAFAASGTAVSSLKIGPDFIDPGFHAAASGRPARNLDLWAMRESISNQQVLAAGDADVLVVEGVMGLFDGAGDERGSTADAAARYGWPVILVVDAKGQAASVAALAEGFINHRPDVDVAGVIINRIGSDRHRGFVADSLARSGIESFGYIPANENLLLPSRHLGLIQAQEHLELDAWLTSAGDIIGRSVNLNALRRIAQPALLPPDPTKSVPLPALGKRIAVARDKAFAFFYPHIEAAWNAAGTELTYFSPLADEAPAPGSDAVFLPGGYPELHAERLARNAGFLGGLRDAAGRGAAVYGECGGYMVLGETLIDSEGVSHNMAGLLPVKTSFAQRRMTLGYREVELTNDSILGPAGRRFRGHEFHYSTYTGIDHAKPLFRVKDAAGQEMTMTGCQVGSVAGSYIHIVDQASVDASASASASC